MAHIVTPNLGDNVHINVHDPEANTDYLEVWEFVTVGNSSVYKTPDNRYMTYGVIGWFDVTDRLTDES